MLASLTPERGVAFLSRNKRAFREHRGNRDARGTPPARLGAVRLAVKPIRIGTERSQADVARRTTESQFKGLFDRAPIGLAFVDMGGKILAVNAAWTAILGYGASELRYLTFTDFTHADDIALNWSLFQEVLAGRRDSYSMDKRYIHKDGRIVWGHLAVSVTRDDQGNPASIIGMLLDMTERHEADLARERAKIAAEELAQFRQQQVQEAEAMAAVGAAMAAGLDPIRCS
jgi:PAS domain S-box-containing protein